MFAPLLTRRPEDLAPAGQNLALGSDAGPAAGTWDAAHDASRTVLSERGPLGDPDTNLEAEELIDDLAALMVAFGCVPGTERCPVEPPPNTLAHALASDRDAGD